MSEIPSESRAKGTVFKKSAPGTRGSATPIEDYLATQVESPRIADDAKQKFTEQDVKINELVGSTGLSANKAAGVTSAGQRTVTGPSAIQAQTGTTTATGAPSALTQRTMTAATVGTPTSATAATQTGLGASTQVTGQTRGTVTGAATAATANPVSQAIAQAAEGNVNQQALAAAVTGQSATVSAQTASLPGNIQAAVTSNPASVTAATVNNPPAVNAQIASIPADTLVSGQMEKLLTGIET